MPIASFPAVYCSPHLAFPMPPSPPKSPIYELQDTFWKKDNVQHFSPTATRLYFYWLHQFNAAFWPVQLARRSRQVEADLGLTDKTLAAARKGLVDRGMLAYQEGGKRHAAVWQLPGATAFACRNATAPTTAIIRNNSGQGLPIAPPTSRNNSEPSAPITPPVDRNNSGAYIEETKTRSITKDPHHPHATTGGGWGRALADEVNADLGWAAPPTLSPPSDGGLPAGDESDGLARDLAALWHITPAQTQKWAKFVAFARTMAATGRSDEVRAQFEGYRRHRQVRGLAPHAVEAYLGSPATDYADGEWCGCNWPAKAAEAPPKPGGHAALSAPARATASPSTSATFR
jgi:hypothetical protein